MRARAIVLSAMLLACLAVIVSTRIKTHAAVEPSSLNSLKPFEFHREGATQRDVAAVNLFQAFVQNSPKHFVQNLLLGTCYDSIDVLQDFAECMHTTKFKTGDDSYCIYDLPKGLDASTVRVLASSELDSKDKDVAALYPLAIESYYAEKFGFVDVAADGFDGRQHSTRIVVATVNDRWYVIPRVSGSISFYAVADAKTAE